MGDLLRFTHASIDRLACQVIQPFTDGWPADMTSIHSAAQHGSIHGAGQNGIDADIIRCKFNRHGARQGKHAALAGRVGDLPVRLGRERQDHVIEHRRLAAQVDEIVVRVVRNRQEQT